MVKVKVLCGRFSHNGIVYKNGNIVEVNENLNSIRSLINIKYLEVVKQPIKKETVSVETIPKPIVDEPIETVKKIKRSKRKE